MEQRFCVYVEGAVPKIYRFPAGHTARLRNEYPGRQVQVFETLGDAKQAALAHIERLMANARPSIRRASIAPSNELGELRRTISNLTEDRVERFRF